MRGYVVNCEQYLRSVAMTNVSMTLPGTPLSKKVQAALNEAYLVAEQSLRSTALISGWPDEAANDISISDTKITLGSLAADLEFGLPGRPPSPVVRTSTNIDATEAVLMDDVYERLKKAGVL